MKKYAIFVSAFLLLVACSDDSTQPVIDEQVAPQQTNDTEVESDTNVEQEEAETTATEEAATSETNLSEDDLYINAIEAMLSWESYAVVREVFSSFEYPDSEPMIFEETTHHRYIVSPSEEYSLTNSESMYFEYYSLAGIGSFSRYSGLDAFDYFENEDDEPVSQKLQNMYAYLSTIPKYATDVSITEDFGDFTNYSYFLENIPKEQMDEILSLKEGYAEDIGLEDIEVPFMVLNVGITAGQVSYFSLGMDTVNESLQEYSTSEERLDFEQVNEVTSVFTDITLEQELRNYTN
jgi:hypothetical protein